MKKILSLSLATLLLCGSLTACKGQQNTPSEDSLGDATLAVTSPLDPPQATETSPSQTPPQGENMSPTPITTYQNPLMTAQTDFAWPSYGFGDPFVMRYNGVYYLYVSTKDGSVGVKCWSSTDLVNWKAEGFCANDPLTRGAYAPEVYYYNGYFYMYTSPAGNGHYVLRSTSPTKGFEVVTDNMGMSIDGSVFIANNGKWYFYTAGHGALQAYNMTSPIQMQNGRPLHQVSVNGEWTEGGMVVYHDGYHYLTYTGNHVLSPSYRILYAVSKKSPFSFDAMPTQNPLLISTEPSIFGIGHSSTVKGPDLDSYYIVYHSLVNTTPNRNMNIDRIVFNGEQMEVLGPTTTPQEAPHLPDIYHHFAPGSSLKGWALEGSLASGSSGLTLQADSKLYAKTTFEGDFTAEYNILSLPSDGMAGALFAYTDEQNFGACYFAPDEQKVIIEITVDGVTTTTKVDTIKSFDEDTRFDCLQALQIERCGHDYTFYMNDHLLCTIQDSPLQKGSIGYITQSTSAAFGFIGGTGAVGGRGSADMYKSVTAENGLIPAFESIETPQIHTYDDGSKAVSLGAQHTLTYRILVAEDGTYDASALYTNQGDMPVNLLLTVDGQSIGNLLLTPTQNHATAILRDLSLTAGQHILTVTLTEGEIWLENLQLRQSHPTSVMHIDFEDDTDEPRYTDGSWQISNGKLTMTGYLPYGKRLYGSPNMGDYTVEAMVTPHDTPNCGLILRATHPGSPNFLYTQPSDSDAQTASDWLLGYFVGLTSEGVIIGKQNYGYTQVAQADFVCKADETYHLKVTCKGANIKVYLNGELCIDYTDPIPYMQGMIGVRTYQCKADFDDLKVTPLQD